MAMNNETKIGLGVLLGLLGILGALIAYRTMAPQTTAVASDTVQPEQAASSSPAKPADSVSPPQSWVTSKPALLSPAKPTTETVHRLPDDPGQWNITSAPQSSTDGNRAAEGSASLLAVPAAATPAQAQPDERYGASTGSGASVKALTPPPAATTDVNRVAAPAAGPDPFAGRAATVSTSASSASAGPAAGPALGDAEAAPALLPATGATAIASSYTAPAPPAASTSVAVSVAAPSPTYQSGPRYAYPDAPAVTPQAVAPPMAGTARMADDPGFARPAAGPREDGSYEVQPNDNYWSISEKTYGTGAYFRALAEHNRGKAVRADRLAPGLVISVPPIAQLQQDYPDLCPKAGHRDAVRQRAGNLTPAAFHGNGRSYVVQEGDSLFSIARNELGKASRWAEIYEVNRAALGKEFDYLTPGMQLVLPAKNPARESADRTTRRTTPTYDR